MENNRLQLSEMNSSLYRDTINMRYPNSDFLKKNFFSYNELEKMVENEIIKIFNNANLIIFISDIFLETQRKLRWLCCGGCSINFYLCRDITFLPYEMKFKFIEIFKSHRLNNNDFNIVFDNGIIKKGIVYKKMIVQHSYAFIPLDTYNYKLTEYNIRGFCQIVEELGANKIEIIFSHSSSNKTKINLDNNIELKKIAGTLGFSVTNTDNNLNSSKYILEYPDNNNLILNINKIIKNLENGKYMISIDDYNTNLELQYVINARCRHFITNYSTNFKIKKEIEYNLDMVSQLNIPDIKINTQINKNISLIDDLVIETNVIFNNNYRNPNQLLKFSISPDEIGFNFILNNIKNKYKDNDEIPDKWLLFIWRFINIYCLENNNKKYNHNIDDSDEINQKIYKLNFDKIIIILNKIKQNFTLNEIIYILKNYFHINSQMLDLKNFLDILDYQTKTYDELGLFLTIEKNKQLKEKDSTINLLEFIILKNKNNDKLKDFLQIFNEECIYQIYLKLDSLGLHSFTNLNTINYINDLSNNYNTNNINLDDDTNYKEKYKKLIYNYEIGLSCYEYFENILPFIETILYAFWYNIENLDIDDINIILKTITQESFHLNNLNTYEKLKKYIQKKIDKFKDTINLYNNVNLISNNLNIKQVFKDYLILHKNKKSFIIKKIFLVYKFNFDDITIENNKDLFLFLKKILVFNEKLNIHKITLDKYGFNKIKINLLSGNFNKEFERLWKPFILRYFNFHYPEIYPIIEKKYKESIFYLKDYLTNNLDFLNFNTVLNFILEDIL